MRPYNVLDSEDIQELVDLVVDNYKVTYKPTISFGTVNVSDDVTITFTPLNVSQETEDEFIFNNENGIEFEVESTFAPAYFVNLVHYVTFYYYELDKGDINNTKRYDDLKPITFTCRDGDSFTLPSIFLDSDKYIYLLKEFQVVTRKLIE